MLSHFSNKKHKVYKCYNIINYTMVVVKNGKALLSQKALTKSTMGPNNSKQVDEFLRDRTETFFGEIRHLNGGEDIYGSSGILIDPSKIVYPDLLFTLRQPSGNGKYYRPLTMPKNDKLTVVGNNTFYRACSEAGLDKIYFDVLLLNGYDPDVLKRNFGLEEPKQEEQKPFSTFVFFREGVNDASQEELEALVQGQIGQDARVKIHPDADCIEYQRKSSPEKGLGPIYAVHKELVERFGKMRSVGGVKKELFKDLY